MGRGGKGCVWSWWRERERKVKREEKGREEGESRRRGNG